MFYQNLLLIDDDADDQEIFLSALESITTTVNCVVAGSGHEALKKLTEKQVEPDLIFLDLNMPMMNGEQVLKELKRREELQQIPVIIFSTTSNPATMKQTKELGAQDFVTKPTSFNDLTTILQNILFSNAPV